MKYPEIAKEWQTNSNYLCQLSISNQEELEQLARKAESLNLKVVRFYEPDLNNQLTAICIEPGEVTKKITSSLPLMLKELKQEKVIDSFESLRKVI